MPFRPSERRRLRAKDFALIVPVGMSDESGPVEEQAFPARSRFFHLPLAKWLPHVTSARRDVT